MTILTDAIVQRADTGRRPYEIQDRELQSFGVRITPSGIKTYFYRYRNLSGVQRRLTLGRHGLISCEAARERAKNAALAVLEGRDPAGARLALIAGPTVADLIGDYLAYCRKRVDIGAMRQSTLLGHKRRLNANVVPALGHMKVADITEDDVLRLVGHIARDRVRTANMCLADLKILFARAEKQQLIPFGTNPAGGIAGIRVRYVARVPTPEDVVRVGAVLSEFETLGVTWWKVVQLVRLLILTGRRIGELRDGRKAWVDLEARTYTVPAASSKTVESVYHIPAPALPIFRALFEAFPYSEWLFPSKAKRTPIRTQWQYWRIIKKKADLDWMTFHHFRHLHASVGKSLGYDLHMLSRLLGHASIKCTDIYAHWYQDSYTEAVERTSGRVADWLQGTDSARAGD